MKGKVVQVHKHHTMQPYRGRRRKALHILNLGTRWKLSVGFTFRPIYSRETNVGVHWIGGKGKFSLCL